MVAIILLACGVWTLVQTGGINNAAVSDFSWRWAETPEERLLAQAGDEPAALPSAPAPTETGAGWPGFRGPDRDGIIRGVRRITVEHGPDGWTTEERWTSVRLKPYFNDSVIHNGHAYGFDGPILACIDIEDGERKWKGGRYGQEMMAFRLAGRISDDSFHLISAGNDREFDTSDDIVLEY